MSMDYSSIKTLSNINMKDFEFLDENKFKARTNENKKSKMKNMDNIFPNDTQKKGILKHKNTFHIENRHKLDKFINIDSSQGAANNKPKPIINKEMRFLMKVIYNNNLKKKSSSKNVDKNVLNMSDYKLRENELNLIDLNKYIFNIEKRLKDSEEALYKKNLKDFVKTIDNIIARYSLIIFSLLKNNETEEAKNIFLLMLKENIPYINYIEQNIIYHYYVSKDYPVEAYELLRIFSFIIKYSRFFNFTNYCNIFIGRYLEIIFFIYNLFFYKSIIRGFTLDTKNQINHWFSLALHNIAYFALLYYFPLNISINLSNSIMSIYQSSDDKYLSKKEKSLLIKVIYNLSHICYLNGQNDKATFYLNEAKDRILNNEENPHSYNNTNYHTKKKKQSMNLYWNNSINKDFFYNGDEEMRLSTATSISEYVKNKGKNKKDDSNKLTEVEKIKTTFSKDKVNLEDIHLLINYCLENGLIDENKSSRYISKNFISPTNIASKKTLTKKLTIPKYYKHPLLFKLELFYGEIELDKKNYILAYNHILKALYILLLLKLNIDGNGFLSFNEEQKIIEKYLILIEKLKEKESENNKEEKSESEGKSDTEEESESDSRENSKNRDSIRSMKKSSKKKYKEESEDIILNKYNLYLELFKENEKGKKSKEVLYCSKEDTNYKVLQDIEKFFLFLCSLSLYQISILNNTQPENKKGNDLPLLFSSQFKDCLSSNQRKEFNNLQTMALNRCLILKNPNDWIMPNNLNIDLINEKKVEKLRRKKTYKYINKYPEENINENQLRETKEYKIYQKMLLLGKMTKETRDIIVKNNYIVLRIIKKASKEEIENIIESPKILIKPIKHYKKHNKKFLEKNSFTNKASFIHSRSFGVSGKNMNFRVSLIGNNMFKTKLRLQKNLDLKKENIKFHHGDDFFQRLSTKKEKRSNSKMGQNLVKQFNEFIPRKKDKKDYNDNYEDIELSLDSSIDGDN